MDETRPIPPPERSTPTPTPRSLPKENPPAPRAPSNTSITLLQRLLTEPTKIIKVPVHGYVEADATALRLLDSEVVQRLRHVTLPGLNGDETSPVTAAALLGT